MGSRFVVRTGFAISTQEAEYLKMAPGIKRIEQSTADPREIRIEVNMQMNEEEQRAFSNRLRDFMHEELQTRPGNIDISAERPV